ncbi:translation initiation factor IF-2 [Candidatus Peregrinibacteria bacterium CG_4_10_14_0_2_um_filter_38_24]|nr:MAG: translation initiation factor IF-2 [Candidatus Peregrinibacteria bacterium CG_4_10_14_0_2_um_filter_38_24]PJC39178.1 MAG: translation initiation factor IF-2 [Candidatus Peregrinibacteria bacterium CG_4_9_14_0_2_um_filter_38_9]
MSTKLSDLAEKLGITLKELREKLVEFGSGVSPKARVIDDDIAEIVIDELKKNNDVAECEKDVKVPVEDISPENEDLLEVNKAPRDVAELYDEIIAEEREREIVKSQRKKMAGKDTSKKSWSDKPAQPIVAKDFVEISDFITVKEFAEKTGIKIAKIIGELMKNGIRANINQEIDFETAQIIADDSGVKLKRIRTAASAEELMAGNISNLLKEDDASVLKTRPPVVCVMGHVDHGKTKLLDAIRSTDVVAGESGGITQHIGAYQVVKKGKLITFLDTPGHEAFTAMRARGAKVTDIAVLVVAADEGVKPQTIEAINHAKEAGVPIIVAMNKMDKPNVNPDRVKGELAEHGLQPEDWGGDTVIVPVSALAKQGIDELLDMVLLTADILDLKANYDREAVGTVVEAHLDHSLGPVATVLVNTGTLRLMDNVVVGNAHGRIKLMRDYNGKPIRLANPSTPVRIAGLSSTPVSGDILQVVKDEKMAKQKAEEIGMITKKLDEEKGSAIGQIISRIKSDKILKIVLKADTKGSLEAIKQSLAKIKNDDVAIKIIHSGVGTITESDITMASASKGIVIGFHAGYDSPYVEKTAEREGVEVRKYTIIYNLLEEVTKLLSGLLDPEIVEIIIGRAEVKMIFLTKKKEMVIGCRVTSGKLENKAKLRVIRGVTKEDTDNIVGMGTLESLRKVDEVVREIGAGNECGIKFVGDIALEAGDILEAFKQEKKIRTV